MCTIHQAARCLERVVGRESLQRIRQHLGKIEAEVWVFWRVLSERAQFWQNMSCEDAHKDQTGLLLVAVHVVTKTSKVVDDYGQE